LFFSLIFNNESFTLAFSMSIFLVIENNKIPGIPVKHKRFLFFIIFFQLISYSRGQIDVNITETTTRKYITSTSYNDEYRWQQEKAM